MRVCGCAYCLKESSYEIGTQYDLRQRRYKGFTLVAMATKFARQEGMCLMPFTQRNLHTKYELDLILKTNELDVLLWLPWQSSFHSNKVGG